MPRSIATAPATAAVLALCAIASCKSSPKVEEPDAAIVGTWRSAGTGAEINFSRSGLYSLKVPNQPRPVMGGFTFEPKEGTLVLMTRRESPLCGDDTGTYLVRIGGLSMDAELVRDTCEMRSKLFAKQFERVGTAPAAPAAR